MDADGANAKQVTSWALRGGQPDWSPDGKRLVFYSNRDGPQAVSANLYTVAPDGSGLRQLTHARGGKVQYLSRVVLARRQVDRRRPDAGCREHGERRHLRVAPRRLRPAGRDAVGDLGQRCRLGPSPPLGAKTAVPGGLAGRRPSRYIRATTPLEFRVLGPLQVASNGTSLPLGGTKQRAVLALLLLRANEVVPLDRLIDELWGESPPDSAANIVQGYVSHLRKALEPGPRTRQARGPRLTPARLHPEDRAGPVRRRSLRPALRRGPAASGRGRCRLRVRTPARCSRPLAWARAR